LSLKPPSPEFSSLVLPVVEIQPSSLIRISWNDTDEPRFGKTGKNRFDDPRHHLPEDERYGASYFGFSLACAFAETVLHDRTADPKSGFQIPRDQLNRWVLRFEGSPLTVAVLTGAHLKRLGGEGALSTIVPYDLPQQWSLAVHEHPGAVDGFAYISRHLNTEQAIVLFDRVKAKLNVAGAPAKFEQVDGHLAVLSEFGVTPY
jgi:hypothetical protein